MEKEIFTLLVITAVTVILLILEVFRIDLIAIICLLSLGWTGILTPAEALSGFSSNAVIAMIAVMIMGTGIAKTGVMNHFSGFLHRVVKGRKTKLIILMSLFVGFLSGFLQNVGTAALFLPAILSISKREKIPASELIMPMGFAVILGGTLTMIGTSPLILLNDLLRSADLEPYGFFSVTPVGSMLLVAGTLYFYFFGKWVLPRSDSESESPSEQKKLIDTWHLPHTICRYQIPGNSSLVGSTPEEAGIWSTYMIHILAVAKERTVQYVPWRQTRFQAGQELALLGDESNLGRFAKDFNLTFHEKLDTFEGLNDTGRAGFVEILIPSQSSLIGNSMRKLSFRKQYAIEPVIFFSGDREIRSDFSDRKIKTGDTLIVYGLWENISRLKSDNDFVVLTPFEFNKQNKGRAWIAILCFAAAIGLTFARFPISITLLSGAVAMVLTRVIRIDEIYRAIEWRVVFLIAGLIPLGIAMQKTGAAEFLANTFMGIIKGGHPFVFVLMVASLSTLFTLIMSNVASTVVLVPLVINMAQIMGLAPRPFALMVAVCAANSFILPTHQVNAMLMTAGGYRNSDYLKAGGGMTILFILVVTSVFYLFFL